MNPLAPDPHAATPASAGPAAAGVPAAGPGQTQNDAAPCWTRIGVLGERTCPELEQFVHCRNCPVYSNAGMALLNRPLPAQYRRAWTEHFARAKPLAEPSNSSALLFRIGPEWFALPTRAFQEVAERRRVHSLPHRRQGLVLGLVNIRGELLLCVSLGHLLGLEPLPSREELRTAHQRLLVCNWEGSRLVFPVDEVQGTHRFHSQDLRTPPANVAHAAGSFTQGLLHWQDRRAGYLNAETLFATLNRSLT